MILVRMDPSYTQITKKYNGFVQVFRFAIHSLLSCCSCCILYIRMQPAQAAKNRKLVIAGTIVAKPALTAAAVGAYSNPHDDEVIGPIAPPLAANKPLPKVKHAMMGLPMVREAGGQKWLDPTLKDFPDGTCYCCCFDCR